MNNITMNWQDCLRNKNAIGWHVALTYCSRKDVLTENRVRSHIKTWELSSAYETVKATANRISNEFALSKKRIEIEHRIQSAFTDEWFIRFEDGLIVILKVIPRSEGYQAIYGSF